MGPLDYYYEQCQSGQVVEDPQQLTALKILGQLHDNLLAEHKKRTSWKGFFCSPVAPPGAYLWGGIGIGKTFLMDCFYHTLPIPHKMRMHFHAFMKRIHADLNQYQGKADPIAFTAKKISKEAMVLCFDEFYVSDVADAMILGRLLKALLKNHVCLVATSNLAPDDLYPNGLQRALFLPAIALLKSHLTVLHMTTSMDYRLRHLKKAGVFYSPLGPIATEHMNKTFDVLASGQTVTDAPIEINGRFIPVIKRTDKIIWFDFSVICNVPRSASDYLVLSERFSTCFISNVPVVPEDDRNTIYLFVNLVDILYDARVKLVMSAEKPVPELYCQGFMVLEYARTHSRLLEMQSEDYFKDNL